MEGGSLNLLIAIQSVHDLQTLAGSIEPIDLCKWRSLINDIVSSIFTSHTLLADTMSLRSKAVLAGDWSRGELLLTTEGWSL
jgi:hypothetical protein